MIVSRCCQDNVWVYSGNESTSFYICEACNMACDTIMKCLHNKDESYDAGWSPET
jgi:hypothetical protein